MSDKAKLRKASRVGNKAFKKVEKFINTKPLDGHARPPLDIKEFAKALKRHKKIQNIREKL